MTWQFLEAQLNCPLADEIAMVVRVAASEMGEDEWTAWVIEQVAELPR